MSKKSRQSSGISRRDFLNASVIGSASLLVACTCKNSSQTTARPFPIPPVVSIVKIKNNDIARAVEDAINLLGGINQITLDKERIMLKPNLVGDSDRNTTKLEVVKTLASLMQGVGKEVLIGEGSVMATGISGSGTCYTKDYRTLENIQEQVLTNLGYKAWADSVGIELVNLHGNKNELVVVPAGGLAYDKVCLHKKLTEIDMLCSVPMMKTHNRAKVTLGMKNLIGLYPGSVYGSTRVEMHNKAARYGSEEVSYEIVDMMIANKDKFGLVVIDGSTAMEGNGPAQGELVPMNVIIAGTNPLATDIIAASVMGFDRHAINHFVVADEYGFWSDNLDNIQVRGESVPSVQRIFQNAIMEPPWDPMNPPYQECIQI